VTHYRIRLAGGTLLHFWADRWRREGDLMVFEEQHPGGGWKVTWEIHAANMEEVIDGDVPPPP
jgi:hypothetical protein